MGSAAGQLINCSSVERICSRLALFLVFINVFTPPTTALLPKANNTCPLECRCEKFVMSCKAVIPVVAPATVRSLVLSRVDSREFYAGRFCHVTWINITEVNFDNVEHTLTRSFDLNGTVFGCLGHISSFKFSSRFLAHFTSDTFSGLKNVSTFDLSGCQQADWQDLFETLSERKNMPRITRLILSNTSVRKLLNINQEFVNVLSYRRIAYLDLSFTRFNLDFTRPGSLCKTLHEFNYENAQATGSKKFKNCHVCDSLRIVNIGNDDFYKKMSFHASCVNGIVNFSAGSAFFSNVRILHLNNTFTSKENFTNLNCMWTLWTDTFLEELFFSYNYFPNFDVILINNKLKLITLSFNEIENINPNAFKYLVALRTIDLSNNNLFKMQSYNKRFSAFFKHNKNLKVVYLSRNNLTSLPEDTFISNKHLQEIYLKANSLKEIELNISNLLNLSLLDLRDNAIQSLNVPFRMSLDSLHDKQRRQFNATQNSSLVQVYLEGNPFSCGCEFLDFLQWFTSSPLFSDTRENHYCRLDGRDIQMTEAAVDAAKKDCARKKRKKMTEVLLSTLLPTCFIVCIIAAIFLYKRHKKKLMERRFQGSMQRLRENGRRFPVFLSYSSDESDFVRHHLLQQLQHHLQLFTGLDRELVCNADDHFHPARTIISEIFRCLGESEVFIAVVSESYCKSRFCRYEIEHAHLLKKPIILIFKEHVEEDNMNLVTKEVFETFTRVQFVVEDGQYRIQPDWPQICESIIQLIT